MGKAPLPAEEALRQVRFGKWAGPALHCGERELRRTLPLPYKKLQPSRKDRKTQVRRNKVRVFHKTHRVLGWKDETQQRGTFPERPEGQALDSGTKAHLRKAGTEEGWKHLGTEPGDGLRKGRGWGSIGGPQAQGKGLFLKVMGSP